MKKLFLLTLAGLLLFSCNNASKKSESAVITDPDVQAIQDVKTSASTQQKLYGVESAHVKYKSLVADQEMIRDWYFDHHGNRQYEENIFEIMGQTVGSKTLVLDGMSYNWNLGENTGTKRKYYHSVTDYEKITEREIERYGIQKHGHETVLGKKCEKITMEKPAKSTAWIWNNIPLKTIAVFAGNEVTIEAIELSTDQVDSGIFKLPEGITFEEVN